MQGKTVLITGGTNGIGKATALELARVGARVIIVGRSAEKAEKVASELRAGSSGGRIEWLIADLSIMTQTAQLADTFRQRYDRLDVLINNAGAIFSTREITSEGLEATFALNHMSYFILTALLLDMLKASAPSRIVNVASGAYMVGINFDDIQCERSYSMGGFAAYGASKMMNILFTYALARRLQGAGVTVNTMSPGPVSTNFGADMGGVIGLGFKLMRPFMQTPAQGARTVIYLASSPEVASATGQYWINQRPSRTSTATHDERNQNRLWELSQKIAAPALAVSASG
jgi:NAD(P)-dependent dehydrogenase (short-subunit alcohol dehydrogenase family)